MFSGIKKLFANKNDNAQINNVEKKMVTLQMEGETSGEKTYRF
jgi:hypothetical protein